MRNLVDAWLMEWSNFMFLKRVGSATAVPNWPRFSHDYRPVSTPTVTYTRVTKQAKWKPARGDREPALRALIRSGILDNTLENKAVNTSALIALILVGNEMGGENDGR